MFDSRAVGKTGCKGRSIARDRLDGLVTIDLADRLLGPTHLGGLLTSLTERRASSDAEVQERARVLQREIAQADDKLRRLYKLVEDGLTDLDETLADRLAALKSDRDRARALGAHQGSACASSDVGRGSSRALRRFHAGAHNHRRHRVPEGLSAFNRRGHRG